jgi:hypothetical protein
VPVPVFCSFSIPDNYLRKYSWNWMKQGPNLIFFPTHQRSPKQRRRGHQRGHTIGWHGPTPTRAALWCGPLGRPLNSPFLLYIVPDTKTLKEEASIHEKFRTAAAIEDKSWGTEISVLAPYRDGEFPPEPSPSTPLPSSLPLLTPMMRRE